MTLLPSRSASAFVAAALLLPAFALPTAAAQEDFATAQATALPRQELDLPATPGGPLLFDLDIEGTPRLVELWPHSVRSPEFVLMVQREDGELHEEQPTPPATYRGSVLGLADSEVRASLTGGQLRGTIFLGQETRLGLQPVTDFDPAASPRAHIVIPKTVDELFAVGTCGADDASLPHQLASGMQALGAGSTIEVAEVAFDSDVQYYQDNFSSVPGTINDIEAVMNGVSGIYESDLGLTFEITVIIVRTVEPDPYSTQNPGGLLNQFASLWQSSAYNGWQRDLAHFMTGKNLEGSVIGIASLGCVCNNSCYGLSSRFTASLGQRVALVAHEMGHQFGAGHCDGASGGCKIMCSGLGACGTVNGFGPASINTLTNAISNDNCYVDLGPPITAPFSEDFGSSNLDRDVWIVNDDTSVSTSGVNEPSGPWSLNLDASSSAADDQNEIWTNDMLLAGGSYELRFFSEHRGVPSGGALVVEYRSLGGDWVEFYRVTSNGVTQNSFVENVVLLPTEGTFDGSRIKFRTEVSSSSHDWFVDDITLEGCSAPTSYCVGKLSSDGCVPTVQVDGLPSLTDPNPVNIQGVLINAQKPGLMIYSYAAAALPFQDGTLCCEPPLRRTDIQQSGGLPLIPCDGSFNFDMNAHIQSGIDPFLTLGTQVNCQYWFRDSAAASQTGLSNAVQFLVCP